jgi:hypothetical protein
LFFFGLEVEFAEKVTVPGRTEREVLVLVEVLKVVSTIGCKPFIFVAKADSRATILSKTALMATALAAAFGSVCFACSCWGVCPTTTIPAQISEIAKSKNETL